MMPQLEGNSNLNWDFIYSTYWLNLMKIFIIWTVYFGGKCYLTGAF